ncbi:MAG: hypothetical protein ACI9WT_001326 [Flavobacterium sp.]
MYLKAKKPEKRTGTTQTAKLRTKVLLKNSNIFSAFLIGVVSCKESKTTEQ